MFVEILTFDIGLLKFLHLTLALKCWYWHGILFLNVDIFIEILTLAFLKIWHLILGISKFWHLALDPQQDVLTCQTKTKVDAVHNLVPSLFTNTRMYDFLSKILLCRVPTFLNRIAWDSYWKFGTCIYIKDVPALCHIVAGGSITLYRIQ